MTNEGAVMQLSDPVVRERISSTIFRAMALDLAVLECEVAVMNGVMAYRASVPAPRAQASAASAPVPREFPGGLAAAEKGPDVIAPAELPATAAPLTDRRPVGRPRKDPAAAALPTAPAATSAVTPAPVTAAQAPAHSHPVPAFTIPQIPVSAPPQSGSAVPLPSMPMQAVPVPTQVPAPVPSVLAFPSGAGNLPGSNPYGLPAGFDFPPGS